MSLRVSFELDDNDLTHFRLIMREARKTASRMAPEDIVATAEDLLQDIGTTGTPGFIQQRIEYGRARLPVSLPGLRITFLVQILSESQ